MLYQVLLVACLIEEAFVLFEEFCGTKSFTRIFVKACCHKVVEFFRPIAAFQLGWIIIQNIHDYFHWKEITVGWVTMRQFNSCNAYRPDISFKIMSSLL